MVGLSLFSLLLNVWKKRCAWAALSRGVVFLKPTDISNWNWGLFFFLSVTFKVVSIRGSYFSEKLYFFNFLVSWRKVGFIAVYLSTLKQIFFLKLACCKVYPLIYSFVRGGISSQQLSQMCSWITNRRGITYVLLILVQITTNSIPLKRATVTFFFTSLSKSEWLNFYKRFVLIKWCSHSDRESKEEWPKSWVIWKPRVSSFLLIYVYVTQVLTIKIFKFFFWIYLKKATVFTALWLVGTISFHVIL